MKLRNKRTGQLGNFIINKDHFECVDLDYAPEYRSLAELNAEWEDVPDSDYEIRKTNGPVADFFPMGALAVLGALEGKSAEEMAQSLLEQENKLKEEYERQRKGTK